MKKQASILALVALGMGASGCGGGGGGDADAPSPLVTEMQITDQQRFSLQGDWPASSPLTSAFIVRSQAEWDQRWAERKAAVYCGPGAPYNQAFCDSDAPPPVDFSRYALVGLLISSVFYFDEPVPTSVEQGSDELVVTYKYIDPSHTPAQITTSGRFFLVPQTATAFRTQSKRCSFSC